MRGACKQSSRVRNGTLLFEFTRKKFHDPFPLPFVNEDLAMFLLVRGDYSFIG